MSPSLNRSNLRIDFRPDFRFFRRFLKSAYLEARFLKSTKKSISSIFESRSKIWLRACSTPGPLGAYIWQNVIGVFRAFACGANWPFTSWLWGRQNGQFEGSGVGNSDFRRPEGLRLTFNLRLVSLVTLGQSLAGRDLTKPKMTQKWVIFGSGNFRDQNFRDLTGLGRIFLFLAGN